MRRRCEAEDEQACVRIAKARYGLAPVDVVAMRRLLVAGDSFAIGSQARAAAAADDVAGDEREGTDWHPSSEHYRFAASDCTCSCA